MPQQDLPRADLEAYDPALAEPADLEAFWTATLEQARRHPVNLRCTPASTGLSGVATWDVTFAGHDGQDVRGWLHLPVVRERETRDGLPAVVQYLGYGGGRGLPHENLLWAVAGYAHFVMDTRGQGSDWSVGDTPDPVGSLPSHPGFATRGILDPETYYYRRVFTDAVRAVEAIRTHPAINADRIAITGSSQGGGITLAVASLLPDVTAVMPDVPFLCDFPRAVSIADRDPYAEIARYLAIQRTRVEQVFRTLSYFDAAVLGRRATAPALFSVALMDDICPPSTVYAAFHAYAGPKRMEVYAYNGHEGGQADHVGLQLGWLPDQLG